MFCLRNPLTFRAKANLGEKWCEMWKKWSEIPPCILSVFTFCERFRVFHNKCIASLRPAIYLSWNRQKWAQNVKNEKCIAGYFAPLFLRFTPLFSLFAFCSNLCQGWHSRKTQRISWFYFFTTLIKHEIRIKCEKCIVNVSHFVACFTKCEIRKMCSQPKRAAFFPVQVTKKLVGDSSTC